jgi:hypothetical protein
MFKNNVVGEMFGIRCDVIWFNCVFDHRRTVALLFFFFKSRPIKEYYNRRANALAAGHITAAQRRHPPRSIPSQV